MKSADLIHLLLKSCNSTYMFSPYLIHILVHGVCCIPQFPVQMFVIMSV
jgi:hypothetical protein